jgi:hypothetical protein
MKVRPFRELRDRRNLISPISIFWQASTSTAVSLAISPDGGLLILPSAHPRTAQMPQPVDSGIADPECAIGELLGASFGVAVMRFGALRTSEPSDSHA